MTRFLENFFERHLKNGLSSIALAVSGGADSFALLHMAYIWAMAKDVTLLALTVDHQLRPESATEAETVGKWCTQQHIQHEILNWEGEKPLSSIQESARDARRRLLLKACQRHGIKYLAFGHQADDQAETMVMRLQRGTGLGGLEAMQPATFDEQSGITILRPLLHMKRAELRQYCVDHELPFIDDPSNENRDYERVRVRDTLASLPQLAEGAGKTALRLRRANDTLNQLAQQWLDEEQERQDGQLWLPQTWRTALLPEIQLRVLHIVLNGLKRQRLSVEKLEKLASQMNNIDYTGSNIAGCWVRPKVVDKIPGFLFSLEPPRKA